jgi:hypothetical protein
MFLLISGVFNDQQKIISMNGRIKYAKLHFIGIKLPKVYYFSNINSTTMKVEQKGHTTIIKNTACSTSEFLQKLTHEYNTFKNQNLILDLSHDGAISLEMIKSFVDLIKAHANAKKSLVLVHNNVNYNTIPSNIVLLPTILEAHDIIEIDEIERDLGF